MRKASIWIGFEPREAAAFAVAKNSIERHCIIPIPIKGVVLSDLQEAGLYTRPIKRANGRIYDPISRTDDYDGAMATEFAISRFLVPHLAGTGWALFIDCDFMALGNVDQIFNEADSSKAVMCVKHKYEPPEGTKMDGQFQSRYARKNWSSCMLFNCDHPANEKLTVELINTVPGRDLHRFCWLDDDNIGELHPRWNYLVGHTPKSVEPVLVHHTEGIPLMDGYEDDEYSEEWHEELRKWAR